MVKLTANSKHPLKVGNHPQTHIPKPGIMRRGEYKCRILKMHLKLRDQQLKTIFVCVCVCRERERERETAISKAHGKQKSKIYKRYTHKKRKSNPSTTLKIVFKPQENKRRRGEKRPTKINPEQLTKWL